MPPRRSLSAAARPTRHNSAPSARKCGKNGNAPRPLPGDFSPYPPCAGSALPRAPTSRPCAGSTSPRRFTMAPRNAARHSKSGNKRQHRIPLRTISAPRSRVRPMSPHMRHKPSCRLPSRRAEKCAHNIKIRQRTANDPARRPPPPYGAGSCFQCRRKMLHILENRQRTARVLLASSVVSAISVVRSSFSPRHLSALRDSTTLSLDRAGGLRRRGR